MLALLALETGHIFHGRSIGVSGIRIGEVVFNTALTGYQETLTDPSYTQQIISFTYPHIGNTGINTEDNQSSKVYASGVIVKSLSKYVSNWRATMSLTQFLQQQQVVGIEGVDTRSLTKILREHGSLRGCLMAGIVDEKYALAQAKNFTGLENADLTSHVSTAETYTLGNETGPHVVVVDFGVKHNILQSLLVRNCKVTVVPAKTKCADIIALAPDGVLLSNGPGDPSACSTIIENIKQLLLHEVPILGICLGHQLLALALLAKTFKMSFGHHGSNHPVYDLAQKRVLITSQNHGFAVDATTLSSDLEVTHYSLFDSTLQGFKHKHLPWFGFQGHPEAAPGPQDALGIFDEFLFAIRGCNAKAQKFA